jgi:hypothetical protein
MFDSVLISLPEGWVKNDKYGPTTYSHLDSFGHVKHLIFPSRSGEIVNVEIDKHIFIFKKRNINGVDISYHTPKAEYMDLSKIDTKVDNFYQGLVK